MCCLEACEDYPGGGLKGGGRSSFVSGTLKSANENKHPRSRFGPMRREGTEASNALPAELQ